MLNTTFELVKFEPQLNEIKEYICSVKNDSKENRQQTKSITSLSRRKLTIDQHQEILQSSLMTLLIDSDFT
jgi:hypothetical protein